jgi:putative ABC transport system permease protein
MLAKDFLYSARSLRASPGFTVTAVLTVALGIGATTAIFSVVNAVLLSQLPYAHSDRLVLVWVDLTRRDVKDFTFSPGDFADLRRNATLFEDLAAVWTTGAVIGTEEGEPEQVRVAGVTPGFLRLLGGRIIAGRDFQEEDGVRAAPQAGSGAPQPRMALLSHSFWQRRYGGRREAIGRSIDLGTGRAEVVGVLAPGFELLFPPGAGVERLPDLWTAARLDYEHSSRVNVFLRVVGRLRSGVTLEQAQAQVDGIGVDLRRRFPISEAAGLRFRLERMHDDLVADVRPAILALMGSVVFLLLIACANVANLLLVKASAKERELALRAALGGSRWRLIRQALAESLLLAMGGVLIGIGVAYAGVRVLMAIRPADVPGIESAGLDGRVLFFAVMTGVAAALVFGLTPALRASRPGLMEVLRSTGRTSGLAGVGWMRNGVVILEVALSFVLLVGCGLMMRSFVILQRTDPGFDPQGLLTFQLAGARHQQRTSFTQELRNQLAGLPGVQSVSASSSLPMIGPHWSSHWGTEEARTDMHKLRQVTLVGVQPGYFETLRSKLITGRTFTDADNIPSARLAVVDEVLAARAFPNQSAVGKRVLARLGGDTAEWFEVVGVVSHHRIVSLADDPREQIFVPDSIDSVLGQGRAARWVIRAGGDPLRLTAAVRATVARMGGRMAVTQVQTMDAVLQREQAPTRFALLLIGAFAIVAGFLAIVGLYGVLSTSVRQRTAELGVRMALGATPSSIFGLVVGQGLKLSMTGIALGVIGAVALTRVMTSMLVGIEPTDKITFASMPGVFLLVSAAACWIPAARAARLDPNAALREE